MTENFEQLNNLSPDQQRLNDFLIDKSEDIEDLAKASLDGRLQESECSDEILQMANEFVENGNTDIPIKQVITSMEEIKNNVIDQLKLEKQTKK